MNSSPTNKCEVCGAHVSELRRRRCWGCYSRWVKARPVGFGAACILCSDRRRENLKSVELLGAWLPTCHNCSARAAALDPMPRTIAAIRKQLGRERRKRERRIGKNDTRVFQYDRRTSQRRDLSEPIDIEDLLLIDETMILEISEMAQDSSLDGSLDNSEQDMTRIIDLNCSDRS